MNFKIILSSILLTYSSLTIADGADYRVPVSPLLAPYAQFQLQGFELSHQGSRLSLKYNLPLELMGKSVEIKMSGVIGTTSGATSGAIGKRAHYFLNGPHAHATCVSSSSGQSCQVKYKNLPMDSQAVDTFLQATAQSSEEYQARTQVAQIFGADPIGVVSYFY